MSNDWFQFKQFTIQQDKTAMKVGTDGVLLGAWVDCSGARRVLDVGTGTGLLALMVAQRYPGVVVDAIEIEKEAWDQALENFKISAWPNWLNLIEGDFLEWSKLAKPVYDQIICNPPFFSNSLEPPDDHRAKARHEKRLPLIDFIKSAVRLLNPTGSISLIVPIDRLPKVAKVTIEQRLFLNRILRVKGSTNKPVKRVLLQIEKKQKMVEISEMEIKSSDTGEFSKKFVQLTKDFYLNM